jgi:protein-disulfide isomerase
MPKGVTKDTYGVKVGSAWTAANAESIPKLQIWEDFQCPACGQMEKSSGATILKLAKEGKVRLEWRPTIFLDSNLSADNTANGNPDSSLRATNAFGCAVDQGYAEQYHSALFAAQPATEGQGYSAADLTAVAQTAGMTDQALTKFMECSTNKIYEGWANNSYAAFQKDGISSTPNGILNGTELTNDVLYDPTALTKAIADATK